MNHCPYCNAHLAADSSLALQAVMSSCLSHSFTWLTTRSSLVAVT